MSSEEVVLRVKNVSKRFEIYASPRHRLQQMLFGHWKKYYREFWALRDIDFEVKRGECVGVIGKNGAGKSTLLQILVGTLSPTSGSVETKGRVAALLELGSGFSPEFTGRENVYMNAAILGLKKAEIDAKYQEIVDFADIGDFIDQPVKTYSSGMMVRLAFAVQVMVEPDILIVDEALAVGDAAFQRKCYARLAQLVARGMTLFLVTHDIETVKRLCHRVIFLKNGCCMFDGDAVSGVAEYMKLLFPTPPRRSHAERRLSSPRTADNSKGYILIQNLDEHDRRHGVGGAWIREIRIHGLTPPNLLYSPCSLNMEIDCEWEPEKVMKIAEQEGVIPNLVIGFGLTNNQNTILTGTNTFLAGKELPPQGKDHATIRFSLKVPEMAPGRFYIVSAITLGTQTCSTALDWNDFSVEINSINEHLFGGVFSPCAEVTVL